MQRPARTATPPAPSVAWQRRWCTPESDGAQGSAAWTCSAGHIDLIPDIDLQASIMASTAWQRQEGRTQCLLGDVLETKNRLDEALAVFHEALAISQRLASIDPSNAGGQRDLAVAHHQLGQVTVWEMRRACSRATAPLSRPWSERSPCRPELWGGSRTSTISSLGLVPEEDRSTSDPLCQGSVANLAQGA